MSRWPGVLALIVRMDPLDWRFLVCIPPVAVLIAACVVDCLKRALRHK